ncbi:uroporphyrin-3 C-methyltransferase [Formivibrio citricus]|uniref:Uroporphyrin-3 C-methyltransferase n=1 Tax=Formivibrio citricus TaxID=83765 RepID=A0A1I5C5V1_9NEIS|nr:uroporphyrinogen-III C-methyltransferase [Formivibrio citricus]SFN82172.1 uroporphyrin-3 C-methyltransferase [Formivibrio citricus]
MSDNPQDSLSAALKPAPQPKRKLTISPPLAMSVAALLVASGFGAYQYYVAESLRQEVSQVLSQGNKSQQELQSLQGSATQHQQQLDARLAVIEARQADARSQQAALATMYDALTRSDSGRTLAEIEQTLTFASQQLQLTGNVASALVTLAGIDQKLGQLNRPELLSVRQAVSKDLDTLKALPPSDLAGITVKLDSLATSLDKLPLAIDGFREPAAPLPAQQVKTDRLTRFGSEVWHAMKQLIQIRRMDKPDAMLLSPEQAFFLRENIKLRLMDARTALLLRDETTYRADLRAVNDYLNQYFDKRAPQTANKIGQIQELIAAPLALKLPDLGGSLAAARNARATAERVKP